MSYLTVAEVARVIGKTPARVRQLADSGEMPALRTATGVRFFEASAVKRYLKRRRAGPEAGRDNDWQKDSKNVQK